jgi:hypothetical protein
MMVVVGDGSGETDYGQLTSHERVQCLRTPRAELVMQPRACSQQYYAPDLTNMRASN